MTFLEAADTVDEVYKLGDLTNDQKEKLLSGKLAISQA